LVGGDGDRDDPEGLGDLDKVNGGDADPKLEASLKFEVK
jgi:hypothetical protein